MNPSIAPLVLASVLPYLAVAYLWTLLVPGGADQFWRIMGILIAVRFGFAFLDAIASTAYWHIAGRRRVQKGLLAVLRENTMPVPHPDDHDMYGYVSRIASERETPPGPVEICEHISAQMAVHEALGAIAGMRFHAAADAAFRQFRLAIGSPSKS